MLSLALVFSFSSALGATADGLATDADYDFVTTGTTTQVKTGREGTFAFSIAPKNGFKVSEDTPLSIALMSDDGLQISQPKIGRKDVVDPKAKSPAWKVAFTGAKPGAHDIKADLVFFLCSDKICQRMTASKAVAVTVK